MAEANQRKAVVITGVEAVVMLALALYLLRRFAAPQVPWWVRVCVLFGWLLGFSGVLLLPLDLAITRLSSSNASTISGDGDSSTSGTLVQYWEGMFWASAVMAYGVFPLLKGVVSSGAFSCGGKLRDSIRKSLISYLVLLAVAVAVLVWVKLAGLTMAAFLGFVMALSNIYGLLLIIVLMSYGFVDVPRYFWNLGDYPRMLRRLQLQVGAFFFFCMDGIIVSHHCA